MVVSARAFLSILYLIFVCLHLLVAVVELPKAMETRTSPAAQQMLQSAATPNSIVKPEAGHFQCGEKRSEDDQPTSRLQSQLAQLEYI